MQNNLTKKRIFRDLKEITESNLVGIAACLPNEQEISCIMANIQIQDGIYNGLLIPVILDLPKDYPLSPPAAYVVSGHPFDHNFHEHVIGSFSSMGNSRGASLCTDLTSNFASFFQKQQGSGWSPAYTIQSILIQLQTFLSRPDLPKQSMPSILSIRKMLEEAQKFTHSIKIRENGKISTFLSTFDKPFPYLDTSIYKNNLQNSQPKIEIEYEGEIQLNEVEKSYEIQKKLKIEIVNKLICPITKTGVYDDDSLKFGYPMNIIVDKFNRLQVTPVIEIISKEGLSYLKQSQSSNNSWKSIFGFDFNHWIPLYINENHFLSVKETLFSLISELTVSKNKKFDPTQILNLIPPILVKTAIHFLKGEVHQSYAAIDAYCQYQYLLTKMIHMFPEIQKEIDSQVNRFMSSKDNRQKREAGDLGEFMIKTSLSKYGFFHPKITLAIFREFLTRQVSWIMKEDYDIRTYFEKTKDLVKKFFSKGDIAKQFYLLQNETTKILVNDSVLKEQENRFGFISDESAIKFRKNLIDCQNQIKKNDWTVFVKALNLNDQIPDEKTMYEILTEAFLDAKVKYSNEINSAIYYSNK